MLQILGNRKIVLCRELTKKFEEFIRGDIESAIQWMKEHEIRGEFCIIVEGGVETDQVALEKWWDSLSIIEHVNFYVKDKNMASKDAIKQVAKDRNAQKRDIYQAYHVELEQ